MDRRTFTKALVASPLVPSLLTTSAYAKAPPALTLPQVEFSHYCPHDPIVDQKWASDIFADPALRSELEKRGPLTTSSRIGPHILNRQYRLAYLEEENKAVCGDEPWHGVVTLVCDTWHKRGKESITKYYFCARSPDNQHLPIYNRLHSDRSGHCFDLPPRCRYFFTSPPQGTHFSRTKSIVIVDVYNRLNTVEKSSDCIIISDSDHSHVRILKWSDHPKEPGLNSRAKSANYLLAPQIVRKDYGRDILKGPCYKVSYFPSQQGVEELCGMFGTGQTYCVDFRETIKGGPRV